MTTETVTVTAEDFLVLFETLQILRDARAAAEFGDLTVDDVRNQALADIDESEAGPDSYLRVRGKLQVLDRAKAAFDALIERRT